MRSTAARSCRFLHRRKAGLVLAVAALCGATLPAQAPALSGRRHCRPIGWHASTAFCRVMMIQLLPGRTDIGQVFPTLVYQALVEPDGTE